jgi:hypothetical protein
MKDFLLNKDFSMLEVPSSELIPLETKGITVMRKLTLTFNLKNKTFDLGYLNYTKDSKNVRNSYVHTYYLALDSRLASFIAFLQDKYREQNSQVDNIVQVSLKVSVNPTGGIYYTLIMKGDRTVPLSFKPSEFKDHENEIDPTFTQCMEPLVESIIKEKNKTLKTNSLYQEKEYSIEQQIISIGKELEEIKLLRDKKIKQLKDLVDNYDLRAV